MPAYLAKANDFATTGATHMCRHNSDFHDFCCPLAKGKHGIGCMRNYAAVKSYFSPSAVVSIYAADASCSSTHSLL